MDVHEGSPCASPHLVLFSFSFLSAWLVLPSILAQTVGSGTESVGRARMEVWRLPFQVEFTAFGCLFVVAHATT